MAPLLPGPSLTTVPDVEPVLNLDGNISFRGRHLWSVRRHVGVDPPAHVEVKQEEPPVPSIAGHNEGDPVGSIERCPPSTGGIKRPGPAAGSKRNKVYDSKKRRLSPSTANIPFYYQDSKSKKLPFTHKKCGITW